MRLKLVRENTNFDFFKRWRVWVGFSVLLMAASVAATMTLGLNFGIDFRGGTTIRTQATTPVDIAAYRAAITPLNLGDVSIIKVFDPNFAADENVTQIRIQAQDGQEAVTSEIVLQIEDAIGALVGGALTAKLDGVSSADLAAQLDGATVVDGMIVMPAGFSLANQSEVSKAAQEVNPSATADLKYRDLSFPSVESVGPKVSGELIKSAIYAVIAAMAAVLIYIWLRFEWQFALGAVAALVHDVVLTIGVFSIFQIKFDLAIIAALLTIVGYSLNDTVVVFDRVRENLRKYKQKNLAGVLNLSINETLSRTFMTSVTTLLALIALVVLGGDVIRGFVFAMIFGVLVGTYSSIFIASSALLRLGVKRDWSKQANTEGNQFANIDA